MPAYWVALFARSLHVGKRADTIVLEERDERALVHGFAGPPPRHVVLAGNLISYRH